MHLLPVFILASPKTMLGTPALQIQYSKKHFYSKPKCIVPRCAVCALVATTNVTSDDDFLVEFSKFALK